MKLYAPLAVCALTLAACETDHRFETHARYVAPIGGFEVAVDASGIVKAGDDISENATATVTIRASPATSKRGAPLRLQLTRRPLTRDASVSRAARDAGYAPSDDEAAELDHAVGGALSGPKGTLMDGQTHALRVVEVHFVR